MRKADAVVQYSNIYDAVPDDDDDDNNNKLNNCFVLSP